MLYLILCGHEQKEILFQGTVESILLYVENLRKEYRGELTLNSQLQDLNRNDSIILNGIELLNQTATLQRFSTQTNKMEHIGTWNYQACICIYYLLANTPDLHPLINPVCLMYKVIKKKDYIDIYFYDHFNEIPIPTPTPISIHKVIDQQEKENAMQWEKFDSMEDSQENSNCFSSKQIRNKRTSPYTIQEIDDVQIKRYR